MPTETPPTATARANVARVAGVAGVAGVDWPALLLALAAAVVLASRVYVIARRLAAPDPALTTFEEDGFYVLSVARNLAAGLGPTADGVSRTTGFQPLWTALATLPYLAAHTDRVAFAILYAIDLALEIAGALLFARLVVARGAGAREGASFALAALVFLAAPDLQHAYANGMETGLYATGLLLLARAWPIRSPARLGLAIGLLALVRIDALVLGAALYAWELVRLARERGSRAAISAVLRAGLLSAIVVAPWLAYCFVTYGHPMPQSGFATRIGVNRTPLDAHKLLLALGAIARFAVAPLAPIYRAPRWLVTALGLPLLALLAWASHRIGRLRRMPPPTLLLPLAVASAPLVAWYLVVSGATWYYGRYFVAIELVVLMLLARALVASPTWGRALAATLLVGCAIHRAHVQATQSLHLGPDIAALARSGVSRVGMFEAGRAGYRLPRVVVNLDGKVNAAALDATREHRFLPWLLATDLRALYLADYLLPFLDGEYPAWRSHFRAVGKLAEGTTCTLYLRDDAEAAPAPSP